MFSSEFCEIFKNTFSRNTLSRFLCCLLHKAMFQDIECIFQLQQQKWNFALYLSPQSLLRAAIVTCFSRSFCNYHLSIETIPKQSFADVLQNRRSSKFRKCHKKTPVLESLFNKVADLKGKKRGSNTGVFPIKFVKFFRTPFLQNTSGHCFWQ